MNSLSPLLLVLFAIWAFFFIKPLLSTHEDEIGRKQNSSEESDGRKIKPLSENEVKSKIKEWINKTEGEYSICKNDFLETLNVHLSEVKLCSNDFLLMGESFLLRSIEINNKTVNIVCGKDKIAEKIHDCGITNNSIEDIKNKEQKLNLLYSLIDIKPLKDGYGIQNIKEVHKETVEVDGIKFTTESIVDKRNISKETRNEILEIVLDKRRKKDRRIKENNDDRLGEPIDWYSISDSID